MGLLIIQLLTVITFIYGKINCLFDMYQIWQRHPYVDVFHQQHFRESWSLLFRIKLGYGGSRIVAVFDEY